MMAPMDTLWGLLGILFALWAAVFVVGGLGLGWYSYFQVRKLREDLEALRREPAPPRAPMALDPSRAPRVATPVPVVDPRPPEVPAPALVPASDASTEKPGWERRFLENWTGLVGLVIVTLGLGFLAAWAAAVMAPFGRFLMIVAGAAAAYASGVFVERTKPRWTRWGYWLQSLGAAVFLLACLGSGGLPGVTWVTHPLAALGLLVLGVAANFLLASVRRTQPYLTLHVVLSLAALAVPGPGLLILLFQVAVAFLGIGWSWFQRWPYNRAITAMGFQLLVAAAQLRLTGPDPVLQSASLAASGLVAVLVHLASYRRLDRGAGWSRPAFLTHLINVAGAALACGLWAPANPVLAASVLGALALTLAFLAGRARKEGTWWLYRTDRLLALVAAGVVLGLNPFGALPLVLASAALGLVLVFAWTARREGDKRLSLAGEALVFASLVLLPLAALVLQPGTDPASWAWGAGACWAAGLAAGAYFASGPVASEARSWTKAAQAVLPAVFAFPLAALWGDATPFPGVSPGLVLLLPWTGLAWVARRRESVPLAWGTVVSGFVVVASAWATWAWRQGYGLGSSPPEVALAWGGPLLALTLAVPILWPRGPGFLASLLGAAGAWALLAGFAGAVVAPWLPGLLLAATLLAVPLTARTLGRLDPRLVRGLAHLLSTALVLSRLAAVLWGPEGPSLVWSDAAALAVTLVLAWHRSTGPGPFWELSLAWALGLFWVDLPHGAFPVLVAALALGTLVAGRFSVRAPRIDWYAVALFLAACGLSLGAEPWAKAATLAILVAFLVVDSLAPGDVEAEGSRWRKGRRYLLVLVHAATLALALPTFLDPRTLTFGWSLESALVFALAVAWKDPVFKNASFLALAACLGRLLLVDLSNTDVLTKALTFLSVGGLMVGMNVVYLWSKNRS